MRYGVMIQANNSAWAPGITRFRTKRAAAEFADGVNETGGKAQVIKQNKGRMGWESVGAPQTKGR